MKKQTLWWIIGVIVVILVAYYVYQSFTGAVVSNIYNSAGYKDCERACNDIGMNCLGTVYDAKRRTFDGDFNVIVNGRARGHYSDSLTACQAFFSGTEAVVEIESIDTSMNNMVFTNKGGYDEERAPYANHCCV